MKNPVDTSYLESLIGYNARRVALVAIAQFLDRMSVFGLRPVDFSVLSVINHNPNVTSRELCRALNLLPPNLVGQVAKFEQVGWIARTRNPNDKRSLGLSLTEKGQAMMNDAEKVAAELEAKVAKGLTRAEHKTLVYLLQKIYR